MLTGCVCNTAALQCERHIHAAPFANCVQHDCPAQFCSDLISSGNRVFWANHVLAISSRTAPAHFWQLNKSCPCRVR